MDQEVIDDLYQRATSMGYKKTKDDFVNLLHTDKEVLDDNYTYVKTKGYNKSPEDFSVLVGIGGEPVKKKEEPVPQAPKQTMGNVFNRPLGAPFGSAAEEQLPSTTDTGSASVNSLSESKLPEPPSLIKPEETPAISSTAVNQPTNFSTQAIKYVNPVEVGKEKPIVELPAAIKQNVEAITPDFMKQSNDFAIPELNYRFGDLHFTFMPGKTHSVDVYAPNGNHIGIRLNNQATTRERQIEEAKKLQDFITANSPNIKGLTDIEKRYESEAKKFSSQKEIDAAINTSSAEADILNNDIKGYVAKKEALQKSINELGQVPQALRGTPEYKAKHDELIKSEQELSQLQFKLASTQDSLYQKRISLSKAVGSYVEMKSQQGSWGGALLRNWGLEAEGNVVSGLTNTMIDAATSALPLSWIMSKKDQEYYGLEGANKLGIEKPKEGVSYDDWFNSLPENKQSEITDYIKDQGSKSVKYEGGKGGVIGTLRRGSMVDVFGSKDVTKEFAKAKEEENVGGVVAGIVKMAPLLISAPGAMGAIQRGVTIYAQTADQIGAEMEENPAFKDISEAEKAKVAVPIGIISALIFEAGLKGLEKNRGLMNEVLRGVISKAGANATADQFINLARNEITQKIVGGGLDLAAIGAANKAAEYGVKDIYNDIKGKKMFDNPEFLSEQWSKDVVKAGVHMAIGGVILGLPSLVRGAKSKSNFRDMSDTEFEIMKESINDPNLSNSMVVALKDDVNSGKISIDEAKSLQRDYNQTAGMMKMLPPHLDTPAEKEALSLISERQKIEDEITGKDPALVSTQIERIAQINEELINLSKNGSNTGQGKGTGTSETNTGQVRYNGTDAIAERSRTEPEKAASRDAAKEKVNSEDNNIPLIVANTYNESTGLPKVESHEFKPSDKVAQTKIGEIYSQLQDVTAPDYKETDTERSIFDGYKSKHPDIIEKHGIKNYKDLVEKSYAELIKEVDAQFKALPVKVDFHEGDKNYENSAETMDDVHNYGHLWVFKGGEDHSLLGSKTADENGVTANDKFRAVHDFFGHSMSGYQFGKDGEENAWISHSKMFSPLAQIAMSSETRGQNSFVNYSGVNDVALAKMKLYSALHKKGLEVGDNEMVSIAKQLLAEANKAFQFAEQKSIVLPEEYTNAKQFFKKNEPTIKSTGTENAKAQGEPPSRSSKEPKAKEHTTDGSGQSKQTEESKGDKFESKARKIADAIRDFELPDWMKADIEGAIKKMGAGADEVKQMIADAVVHIGKLMDSGMEFAKAIKEATQKLVDHFGEKRREKIEREVTDLFNKGVGLSEETLPGYDRLMKNVDGIVTKVANRGEYALGDRAHTDATEYVKKSSVYENASDTQREQLIRKVNEKFERKEKSAPSVAKILGKLEDVKKITVNEMTALKDQIKLEAKAAKDAVSAWRKVSEEVSDAVGKMVKAGKISLKQASAVIKKFAKVNMLSPTSVGKFVDFMSKVFADANYADRLSTGKGLRGSIKDLSSNKEKNADLRKLGKDFAEIDPAMVKDIDEYNFIAGKIKESLTGSKIRGEHLNIAEMVNIASANEYTERTLKDQRELMLKNKAEEIADMFGIDTEGMTMDELSAMLDKGEKTTKYNEAIVMDGVTKMFDAYSAVIQKGIEDGIDPMTGEEVSYKPGAKAIIEKFMDMDLSILPVKEALSAFDALQNFLENQSTAKMGATLAAYDGLRNAKRIAEKGIHGKPIKLYWNKPIGRIVADQFTSLPLIFERIFGGADSGHYVSKQMGVADLMYGKSKGEKKANDIMDYYFDKFYHLKANGEDFGSLRNNIERGMVAFMSRHMIGTEAEVKAEFNRRKNLVIESIDELRDGSKAEQKKAELYSDAFDKLVQGSEKGSDVRVKADPVNVDAVKSWVKLWADNYDQMSDVSKNIYNKLLEKDIYFSPDRFTRLENVSKPVDLQSGESAFHGNNGTVYKKESGSLMTATHPESLPRNKSGKVDRYIDLSFDSVNGRAMQDSLIDIETAGPIRQVEAFINSRYYDNIIQKIEDRKLLTDRVELFIKNVRNKNIVSDTDFNFLRVFNRLASMGTGMALGGVFQSIKQVVPVAINTLVNSGNTSALRLYDIGASRFIDKSGYAIANRGSESRTDIQHVNKLLDASAKSKGSKALGYIGKVSDIYLRKFLVNPDVFIARSSWLQYYKNYIEKHTDEKIDGDWTEHELNRDAGDYAQMMVDRQQNISDSDLQGKAFVNKHPAAQLIVKATMPFQSFRMNQTSRLLSDISTIVGSKKLSTPEDKRIARLSLAGYGAEMASFKFLSMGFRYLIGATALSIMGAFDEEHKKKLWDMIKKSAWTGTLTDVASPMPWADFPVQVAANYAVQKIQDVAGNTDKEKDRFGFYDTNNSDFFQRIGQFGIAGERAYTWEKTEELARTGKFTDQYKREKELLPQDKEALKYVLAAASANVLGLAPSEVNTMVTDILKLAMSRATVAKKEGTKDKAAKTPEQMIKSIEKKNDPEQIINKIERGMPK